MFTSIAESNRSRRKIDRVGEIKYNKYGERMELIEYNTAHDVIISFENGYKIRTQYINFQTTSLISPYAKRVYGVGYLGEGKYNPSNSKDAHEKWVSMIKRCYGKNKYGNKDKYVCNEWHNFQNFAEWYYENYYEVDGERMELDKDILVKNNIVYSPETCIFAPQRINALFVGVNKAKGVIKRGNTYNAKISTTCICNFKTYHEAKLMYVFNKKLLIDGVANEYKDKIPKKLYDAMINYKLEVYDE